MLFRRRDESKVRALKLYSVWLPAARPAIDRPVLVETILGLCQALFGNLPAKFDIHGPYGIRKGQSVGIKAFRSKLQRRGHDDYYALDGSTPGSFGFGCLFDAKTGTDHLYTELVFWYLLTGEDVDVVALVSRLSAVFPTDYGYAIDLPSDYIVSAEAKLRRTLAGVGLRQNEELFEWRRRIGGILQGEVRSVYPYNFLNDAQAERLRTVGLPQAAALGGTDLSVLALPEPHALEDALKLYAKAR
jgi:hypothetical protein